MTNYADKTIAYIDRNFADEIMEIEVVDFLPRRGQPLTLATPFADRWIVFEVKLLTDSVLTALVYLGRAD